jgi:hypothetical protein
MPRKRKRQRLSALEKLKKKAPKIPDFTCPDIDHLINYVEDLDILKRGQLTYFKRRMEALRSANDGLRDSGIYWYDRMKEHLNDDEK